MVALHPVVTSCVFLLMANLSSAGIRPMCKYKYWGDRITCEGNLKRIMGRGIFAGLIANRDTLEVRNTNLIRTEGSWFESKNNLKTLRIIFNLVLRTLGKDSFIHFPRLQHLDVSYNQITSLNLLVLYPLRNLQTLNLDHNKLQEIETGLFSSQKRLKILSLSYNEIQHLGNEILSPLIILERLYVNNNRLKYLDSKSFVALENMQFLNLSENDLNVLPAGLFAYQKRLRELHLDGNSISKLPAALLSPTLEMENLSFGGNQIVKLNYEMLESLVRLKRLDVVGCPIECDCSLKNFHQLCVERAITTNITCKKINVESQVTLEHTTCELLGKPTIILYAILGISIFGMLTNIFLGLFFKTQNLFCKRRQRKSVHDYEYVENILDGKGKTVDDTRRKCTPIVHIVLKVYDYLRPIQGRTSNIEIANTKRTNSNPSIPETLAPFRPPTILYDLPV